MPQQVFNVSLLFSVSSTDRNSLCGKEELEMGQWKSKMADLRNSDNKVYEIFCEVLGVRRYEHQILFNALQVSRLHV